MILGGVPIRVATPPKEAEWAKPNKTAMDSALSLTCLSTAKAMGIRISTVAVLLIHMDNNAAVAMKENTMRLPPPPMMFSIISAKRRCRPALSTARANMKPPINRRITGLPTPATASLWVRILVSGKAKNGIIEVAGIGTHSVIHQLAVNKVIAAVIAMAYSTPKWRINRNNSAAARGAPNNMADFMFITPLVSSAQSRLPANPL